VLWLLSVVEFVLTFDESLGTGATFGFEEGVPGVKSCVVLVEAAGAGVGSGVTTVWEAGLVLASESELPRLQPAKARGKLIDRRVRKSLIFVVFIDVFF
jgi:hypothetical protein